MFQNAISIAEKPISVAHTIAAAASPAPRAYGAETIIIADAMKINRQSILDISIVNYFIVFIQCPVEHISNSCDLAIIAGGIDIIDAMSAC